MGHGWATPGRLWGRCWEVPSYNSPKKKLMFKMFRDVLGRIWGTCLDLCSACFEIVVWTFSAFCDILGTSVLDMLRSVRKMVDLLER